MGFQVNLKHSAEQEDYSHKRFQKNLDNNFVFNINLDKWLKEFKNTGLLFANNFNLDVYQNLDIIFQISYNRLFVELDN